MPLSLPRVVVVLPRILTALGLSVLLLVALLTGGDEALLRQAHDHPAWMTDLALGASLLASTTVALAVSVLAAGALIAARQWRRVLLVPAGVIAVQGGCALAKALVQRPRPPAELSDIHAAGWSMPSAHSATAMVLYGLLAVTVRESRGGRAFAGCCAAVIVAVGVSRVMLGAHYPSDVLAGWALGAVIVAAGARLQSR